MKGLRVGALIVLMGLVLCACIDEGGSAGAGGSDPAAPVIERADTGQPPAVKEDASLETPPEQPAAETEPLDTQPDYTPVPLEGLTNKPLQVASLEGSWIGLFGTRKLGRIEQALNDGHRIDFLPDGQAIWSRLVNGVVVETMDSQWDQSAQRLDLSFSARDAVQSGLASIAPLGIQPDQSGLPGAPAAGSDESFNPMESSLSITQYPSFLVLIDQYRKMMVYGKLPDSDPAVGAQGLAGYWTASLAQQPDGVVGVGFSDGDMVLEGWNEGEFTGEYVKGYFAGRLRRDGTNSYAIAAYNELTKGHIHGIICEGPYYTEHTPFEFVR